MQFSDEKLFKVLKILRNVLFVLLFISLIIYIPQIRESIINIGEKVVGRPLSHDIWNNRFILWETKTVFILLTFIFILFINISQKIKNNESKFFFIISWISFFVFSFFLLFLACESKDIWVDETFSLGLAQHNLKELISLTANDVHPPLYYMILKSAMLFFPRSVIIAKIISTIPIICIVFVANIFFSKEFSYKYSFLFNIIFLSSYSVIEYSIEIRMYSWCMLFIFLCCICSYYMIKDGNFKYFVLYICFAECGAYSHYWTAFGLVINYILISLICIKNNKRLITYIILSAILGILLYSPWIRIVLKQVITVTENYWIDPITPKTVKNYFISIIPMKGLFQIILVLLIIYYCCKIVIKNTKSKNIYFNIVCITTPVLLIIFASSISIILRPIFQEKYAIPFIVFIVFFIILLFKDIKYKTILFNYLLLTGLLCLGMNYISIFLHERQSGYENIEFENTMKLNLTEKTIFVFDNDVDSHIPKCIAYRYPENRIFNIDIPEIWTSAYSYNRNKIIYSLDEEKDICLIVPLKKDPPEEFSKIGFNILRVDFHKPLKFYFMKE